jgi:hypothetical protein
MAYLLECEGHKGVAWRRLKEELSLRERQRYKERLEGVRGPNITEGRQ